MSFVGVLKKVAFIMGRLFVFGLDSLRFDFFDEFCEDAWSFNCHLRQYFAVNLIFLCLLCIDELGVSETMFTYCVVESCDP